MDYYVGKNRSQQRRLLGTERDQARSDVTETTYFKNGLVCDSPRVNLGSVGKTVGLWSWKDTGKNGIVPL